MNEPIALPEWVAALVGRLVLENEALRLALSEARKPTEPINAG